MRDHVVGDHEGSLMEEYMAVEIMEDEEAGKVEPRTPERIRNPGIQVIIRLRRFVIGNHRRARIIIIIVDHFGARIGNGNIFRGLAIFRGWRNGGWRASFSLNRFRPIPVFHGDGVILVGEMNDPVFIDKFVNDGIANPTPGDGLRGSRLRYGPRSDT
jgi:hypothetical protein